MYAFSPALLDEIGGAAAAGTSAIDLLPRLVGRARVVLVRGVLPRHRHARRIPTSPGGVARTGLAMIITQTPLRIGLLGGGTDLPDYYREHGGRVLNCAIDKYVYVIVKQRFDDDIYVNYSRKEIVSRVEDLEHELVREAMQMTGRDRAASRSPRWPTSRPTGSGLGSSSAVTVGLLHALFAYQGRQVSAEELAERACTIEIERCGKPIGKQDQYIAALGGDPRHPLRARRPRWWPTSWACLTAEPPGAAAPDHAVLHRASPGARTPSWPSRPRTSQRPAAPARPAARPRRLGRRPAARAATSTRSAPRIRESWEAKRKLASGVSNDQIDEAVERGARGGGDGRQADRGRRRRLPARHLPHGAPARRAGEPGGHAGVPDKAGPPRLARGLQRDPRHLVLKRNRPSGYSKKLRQAAAFQWPCEAAGRGCARC